MTYQAFMDETHIDPQTGLVVQVNWIIRHGTEETDVSMRLAQPVTPEKLEEVDWPSRFEELAEALYQISKLPKAIVPPPPRST